MEPMTGLEPVTSSLPRTRSTAELHRLIKKPNQNPNYIRRSKRLVLQRQTQTPTNRKQLERETGFEPATNSLEGCDSTTELLPPARSLISIDNLLPPPQHQTQLLHSTHIKLVARGGFEPPKPLGRQIYSLLRLTAPQPRQSQPSSDVRLPPCRTLSASLY